MTTPFPFVAAQVLTASELNSITNLPSSTKTVSYVLTVANAGARVVMNAAGSTTITANTSIFSAGDVVELSNIGAGTCTLTAGTATVSSAGPLAIPQYGGGRLVFTSASAAIYFPSAVTATTPSSGLTFISSGSFGASTTFSLPNSSFTATYLNYLLVINNVTMTLPANLMMRYRASGTDATSADYDFNVGTIAFAGTYAAVGGGSGATQMRIGSLDSTAISCTTGQIYIFNPQTAAPTSHTFQVQADSLATLGAGRFNLTTAFDAVTFRAQSGAGTFGSGTYTLYGLAVS